MSDTFYKGLFVMFVVIIAVVQLVHSSLTIYAAVNDSTKLLVIVLWICFIESELQ